MNGESDSAMIDRLVLGRLPREAFVRRLLALAEAGWSHSEIGALYGLSRDAVAIRLSRARRAK